jgi:hypothetical protein
MQEATAPDVKDCLPASPTRVANETSETTTLYQRP